MTCKDVLETLRERGSPIDAAVARHLERCAACREAHAEEEALVAALRALPLPEPDPGHAGRFHREVRARLEREGGLPAAPSRWGGFAALAAAAVLLAAVGLAVVLRSGGTTSPSSETVLVGTLPAEQLPSIQETVQTEIEALVVESWEPAFERGARARAWAAALTGNMDWIASLTDEDQLALLMVLETDQS
jgi:anti-sigma factor RsiW